MADLESIKRRNAQYEWGELHQHVRLLSLWLLILGTLLILLGIALPALIFAGKISLPYTPSTRILISVGILFSDCSLDPVSSLSHGYSRSLLMWREVPDTR